MTRWEQHILTVRMEEEKVVQIQADSEQQDSFLGNIYVGKVRNVVKNICAAFVEFQKGQIGYLPLDTNIIPLHTDGGCCQPGRVLIGDEIIVQVVREAVKTKPPALSGKIELAGKYLVLESAGELQPSAEDLPVQGVRISKKIQEKEKRNYLKQQLAACCKAEYGFVARTNSALASQEELMQEAEDLIRQYRNITEYGRHKVQFSILKQSPRGYLTQIQNSYQDRLARIITDDDLLYQEIHDYLLDNGWDASELLERWNPECGKLHAVYNITKTLEQAQRPKVWLKSGAYLIIQPTEALVAIDVNTGKAVSKKKDVQQTFYKINLEAAAEIAKQLRLRNLSGMILIDFIDMKSKENQKSLIETLREAVSRDPVQTTVVDMTKLGLVEVTRKKTRKSLADQLKEQGRR